MIGQIEQAIIDRIDAANDAGVLGYKLKNVGTWGGDNSDDLRRFIKSFPAVWVIYAGEAPGRHTSRNQEYTARFNIIVAAQSLRNEKQARRGSIGNVGSYQVLQDVKALILNNRLGLDIQPVKPGRVTPLINEKSDGHLASLYGLEVSVTYRQDQIGETDELNDFNSFHVNWDLPAFGNVGQNGIPDDDNADSTSHLNLKED
tara:strand:+ start:495 stop:1100 length:606 start_codon:yes stop_codon:yes gene_type:complete